MEELENEEIEEQEPIEEESNEVDIDLETEGKEFSTVGDKKVIEKLLMKKLKMKLAIGLGIALFLLPFIILLFDSTGMNNIKYKEPSCTKVKVTYEPFDGSEPTNEETMDIEDYVKRAVYAYTKDIETIESTHVYYAISVALRTEALVNNCEVTYHELEIPTTVPENETLEEALNSSKGIILVDENENLISSSVSNFCWRKKTSEEYALYQLNGMLIPNDFVDENFNNDILTQCPCNKEDESLDMCYATWEEIDPNDPNNKITKKEWLHQESTSGFSVYGAYFLLHQFGKDYNQILQYFFGENFGYRTIIKKDSDSKKNKNETNCQTFSLTTTTLSKEEFVSKVNSYNVNNSNWSLFQNNAGNIYEMGVSNNVNPELIIVRAILEGFSPGSKKHNYFGLNCVNGHPEKCNVYSSFDEGIMGFIKVIQKYESYLELTQRYAYLGDYWFNPGGSGDGGCYYAKYIYPDGLDAYVLDACSDTRKGTCVAKGDKSGCIETRQEDKEAYALYQGHNMLDKRYDIFGISSSTCTNNTLNYNNCVLYSQSDSRWGSYKLGNSSLTISNSGCALTSVAIALTCTGKVKDVDNFSPLVLHNRLNANGGFAGANIYWDNYAIREFVDTFEVGEIFNINKTDSNSSKIEKMRIGMDSNKIGIIHITNSKHIRGHFVVLSTINEEENTITTLDPAGGKISKYSINDVDGFKYYIY